jgi:hypothetical protein
MCKLCALAVRHQALSKSDSLLKSRNLSVLINLNQQSDKLGKPSASNNQP